MGVRLRHCLIVLMKLCLLHTNTAQNMSPPENCQPPSIKQQAKPNIYFIENNDVEITCIATGDGKLSYTWMKDEKPLDLNSPANKGRMTFSPGVGTLKFKAQEEDEGLYQCSVVNDCGTSISQLTHLRRARMDPFPPLDKPTQLKRVLGSSAVLTCDPPESVPKAKIGWTLTDLKEDEMSYDEMADEDFGFKTVTLDRRVTMDYHGNLYITSIRKEDEQDGKKYVCLAENGFTRSTNKGEDKIISTHGTTPSDMGVDLMWHSNTETMVLEGKKARFKCIFSGQPEPEVNWMRVTGNLDKTRMTVDHHELIIDPVQYEDEGEYRCMGKNILQADPKTHTFTLTVEAAPQWRSRPRDTTVGVEESASFECEAMGRPKPTVQWFINGKPYEEVPSNPRRSLKDNTLFFTKLEKDDSQVVQCNSSNIHGYIWSDVFLFVQALPPAIDKKPLDKVIVAEGQDLRVTCQVTGKPKPSVVWYKGNQQLIHQRFQVQDNGDLIIKETDRKDSGQYKCIAQNKFGKTEADGTVVVRVRTEILSGPESANVSYTNQVTFLCGATTDSNEIENLRFRWLKDGSEIKPSERVIINGGELIITETNSKDTGSYICVAENGLDNDTASAVLRVKAVPDAPYNVSVKECLAKRANIIWKFDEKMRNFDTMIKFIIEYTTDYKEGVWMKASSIPYPAEEAPVNLSPYAKYRFRVKAVNLMGISEPSEATNPWCETPMSVPDKNPDNVHTDEQFTGFLVVKWEPMDQIDLNGPKFRYVVEVQEQGTEKVETYEVKDYRASEKRIPVENIYRPYLVKVRAVNQVGKAMASPQTVIGYSGEASPIVVPENFELDPDVNVTATSAGFRWDPVDTSPEMIRGEFSGYKIRFWKTGYRDTTFHEHIVQTEQSNTGRHRRDKEDGKIRGIVANLPSYAAVEADVVVINKNFESNGSNIVNFSTPEGVPGRVDFLEALYRGSHHFLLQWGKPKEQNGVITGYQLAYTKIKQIDFEDKIIAYDDLSPDDDRVTLKGLDPDSQYRIFIRAKTAKGLGKEYFIDVWTNSIVLSMALPVVKHVGAGENEANVTWMIRAPTKGSRYGQLYYLEYMKKNSKDWIRYQHPVEGQFWAELKHLEPGTQYQVRVLAMAHEKGDSQPSESYSFMTAGTSAARASFLTAAWFIGMMVAIAVLILILIIVCIIKRNRGDNYPVQEKERLRGNYNDENQDHFNEFGKGDDSGVRGSSSFDRDVEKVPLDEDTDSLDYGDDDASKFNEDGSFIGQYGRGEKGTEGTNASSIV